MKINLSTLKNLKPNPNQSSTLYFDDELSGFCVKVFSSGKKSYCVRYSFGKKRCLYTIGRHGAITPLEARELAKKFLYEISAGKNPLEEKRKREAQALSFLEVSTLYLEEHAKLYKKGSWKDDFSRLKNHILPVFGKKVFRDITESQIDAFSAKLAKDGKKGTANQCLALLSSIYTFAKRRGLFDKNIVHPTKFSRRFASCSRARFLTPAELRRVASELNREPDVYHKALIWFMMLTGLRKSEARLLKWKDVNFELNMIDLKKTKNGEDHCLPITTPVSMFLRRLPRNISNPYVFVGKNLSEPIKNIDKTWGRVRDRAKVADVWLHDLRRTLGSWITQDGGSLHLVGQALNHSNESTSAIYARFQMSDLSGALEKANARIAEFVKEAF